MIDRPDGPPLPDPASPRPGTGLLIGVLVLLAVVVAVSTFAVLQVAPEEPLVVSPAPRTPSPSSDSVSPVPEVEPGMRSLADTIQDDGGVVLVGSSSRTGESATDAILVGVDPQGSVTWTSTWPDVDANYLGSAPSPFGPSFAATPTVVQVLNDKGGPASSMTIPQEARFPVAFAWMGPTLLVVSNKSPGGPVDPFEMHTTLHAINAEGHVRWSERLPVGFPQLAGGLDAGFVAIDKGADGQAVLLRVTERGLAEKREFEHGFLTLAETPWGVAVGGSVPENTYYFIDGAGHQFATGRIPHSEGWLGQLIPFADGRVAVLTNGLDQADQGSTTITVVSRDGTETDTSVATANPLSVWANGDGITVAAAGRFEPAATQLTGDIWTVDLPLTS